MAPPEAVDQENTTVNLSGSNGTVFLRDAEDRPVGTPHRLGHGQQPIADLVGFGTSNTFETAAAPAPGTTTSISRTAAGRDTDDNGADLAAGPRTPQNTTSSGGGG